MSASFYKWRNWFCPKLLIVSQLLPDSALKAAFSLGARLSPGIAGRLGWALFCTPFTASKPTPFQGQQLAKAKTWTEDFVGRELKVYQWGDSGPVVMMVHGWGGRAHVFGQFVPELLARGMTVVSFDGPAHNGRGGRTNILEYSAAVQKIARSVGPVKGLVGHSFGAMTAAYTVGNLLDLEAVALIGAPDSLDFVLRRAQEEMTVPAPVMDYIYGKVESLSGRPVSGHATSLYLEDHALPLMLVHDEDDKEIPIAQARAMAERLGAQFVGTSGLGHHRILNCPQVATQLAGFMGQRLNPQARSLGA